MQNPKSFMQVLSNCWRLARGLKPLVTREADLRFRSVSQIFTPRQCRHVNTLSSPFCFPSDNSECNYRRISLHQPKISMMLRATYSSGSETAENGPTEAVKELHDRLLESVNVKKSMPPNAWLWSLVGSCQNREDIKLLFDALQSLRRFRLSNLRIHDNFNCNLCREVAKACVRAGAIDFGKKALSKHNVYGLTPSIASAHYLLSHAQNNKDVQLMEEVVKLLKRNNLPLQPGTADIVFRICSETENWDLISKYSKSFIKAGAKLRKTTFDKWMEFAARIGDTESLWKINKLRSETYNQHTLGSAFSCAKGLLLEQKPEDAAAMIQIVCQALPDVKKSDIASKFQNLVNDWLIDVVKRQKEEVGKEMAASLKTNISTMVSELMKTGLEVNLKLDDVNKSEALLS